jgi:tetratricopeptide (TPR) repeat protein
VALHLGYALTFENRASEGIAILEESIKVAETRGFVARHSLRLAYVSEVYLITGRIEDALSAGTRALGLASSHHEQANQAYAHRVLGAIERQRGRIDEAQLHFNAALQASRELQMRPLEAHCYRALAEILEAKQQPEDAMAYRDKATTLAHAMGMRFWGESLVDFKTAG